jgi:hypothetical protein
VWIETSLYTLSALDLITGEIRLIYRYEPGGQRASFGGFRSSPSLTNEPISAIALAPRITVDRREVSPVVFAPRWGSYAIALDGESGRLLWSSPKAPGRSVTGALFGVDAERAYVCGDYVQAIHLADGAPGWSWEARRVASSDVGYAALAGDRVYIPVEGGVQVLSAADGREIETLELNAVLGDSPGFSAVVLADGMLLVAVRDRVVAFGAE